MSLFKVGAVISFRREIAIVFTTLGVLMALPAIAVVLIANAGIAVASSALAAVNPITHVVSIFDASGAEVAQIQATTTWPVKGVVTTEFGDPDPPYQLHHTGTDIADKAGDPITTFMDGTVILVQDDPSNPSGYGKYVVVSHGNGVTSLYGHMEQTNSQVGQTVKPGDVIGFEGNTGHSLGNHVHFEIRVFNIPVNPRTFEIGDPAR